MMQPRKKETHTIKHFGVVRVLDGLFVGDQEIAKDSKFMQQHHVSHIVNCAGEELSNPFSSKR